MKFDNPTLSVIKNGTGDDERHDVEADCDESGSRAQPATARKVPIDDDDCLLIFQKQSERCSIICKKVQSGENTVKLQTIRQLSP